MNEMLPFRPELVRNRRFSWIRRLIRPKKRDRVLSIRQRAVQAITEKNRLQLALDEASKQSADLERQAQTAVKRCDRVAAMALINQKINNDSRVHELQASLDEALEAIEDVKRAVKQQEEDIRRQVEEAIRGRKPPGPWAGGSGTVPV